MKKENDAINIQVADNLCVTVLPNETYEFLMTTNEVAKGYGITPSTLRSCKSENRGEFLEGKHFITSVRISDAGCKSGGYLTTKQTLWTKRGIVRLGFFIKSERAKLFRDWAEDLIIALDKQRDLFGEIVPLEPLHRKKRKINRLTPERVIDLLSEVCRIENKEVRESILDKIKNGHCYGNN